MTRSAMVAVGLLLLGQGCSGDKVTEILVSIATDLDMPEQLAAFTFEVYSSNSPPNDAGTGAPVIQQTFDVDDDPSVADRVTLPATIGLFPGEDPTQPIHIVLTGRSPPPKQEEIIWRDARLPFARDRIVMLQMNLLRSCLYVKCPPGQTCGEQGCESIDKNPDDLPNVPKGFTPVFPFDGTTKAPDGLVDGALPPDGPVQPDAGLPDGPQPDASLPDGPQPDVPPPDLSLPDQSPPPDFFSPDSPWPDAVPPPDLGPPDQLLQPDQPAPPDAATPDQALPDTAPAADLPWPDTTLPPDQSLPDGPAADGLPPLGCSNGWCVLQGGTFVMGSPTSEACRDADEGLQASGAPITVTLTRRFKIKQTEVTRSDWLAVYSADPSSDQTCGANCPVDTVTWHMAAGYCNELSLKDGVTACYTCSGTGWTIECELASAYSSDPYKCPGYRLPTEAEWEFAARAGQAAALYNGGTIPSNKCDGVVKAATDIAWHAPNSGGVKHPVGQLDPNAFELYDMSGNVEEWTADGYPGFYYTPLGPDPWFPPQQNPTYCTVNATKVEDMVVTRGGNYGSDVRYVRSANRASKCRHHKLAYAGFRCVQSLTGTQ